MVEYLLRGIGPPHPKQMDVLNYLFAPGDGIKQADVVCGRSWAKSTLSIIIAVKALSRGTGEVGLFLEPDWRRVRRVFLRKWRSIVPKDLYTLNKTESCITWINGAELYYGPRNVTGNVLASEDAQLGQDLTFCIDDEAALKCNKMLYTNTLGTIRLPSPSRFYLTISTPRLGDYHDLVTKSSHQLFTGSTYDNVYLPEGYIETFLADMSAQQAERDIYGKFVALDDRIWADFDMKTPWPDGNLFDRMPRYDPRRPWYLFCDLGSSTGAYAVVQKIEVQVPIQTTVWVAVADYCPHRDASARNAFRRLRDNFGDPCLITGGNDVRRRSDVSGETVEYIASQVFGGVPVMSVDESIGDKVIQHDRLSYLIKSAVGVRRFCIAKDFVSLDTESHRGIREMIKQDQWLADNKRRVGDYLPKNPDIRVQHIRDALMMGAVSVMAPPRAWDHEEYESFNQGGRL